MPTTASPSSPDKTLVSGAAADSTGWIVALMKEQREFLNQKIEDQKDLMMAVVEGNDVRYAQRFDASKQAISDAFSAAKEAINAALTSADRAVQKAEAASEKRFEGVNEFRNTLADQQRTLMPRAEAEVLFKSYAEKLELMQTRLTEMSGQKQGISDGWKYALGAIGLIGTVLGIVSVILVLFRLK